MAERRTDGRQALEATLKTNKLVQQVALELAEKTTPPPPTTEAESSVEGSSTEGRGVGGVQGKVEWCPSEEKSDDVPPKDSQLAPLDQHAEMCDDKAEALSREIVQQFTELEATCSEIEWEEQTTTPKAKSLRSVINRLRLHCLSHRLIPCLNRKIVPTSRETGWGCSGSTLQGSPVFGTLGWSLSCGIR